LAHAFARPQKSKQESKYRTLKDKRMPAILTRKARTVSSTVLGIDAEVDPSQ